MLWRWSQELGENQIRSGLEPPLEGKEWAFSWEPYPTSIWLSDSVPLLLVLHNGQKFLLEGWMEALPNQPHIWFPVPSELRRALETDVFYIGQVDDGPMWATCGQCSKWVVCNSSSPEKWGFSLLLLQVELCTTFLPPPPRFICWSPKPRTLECDVFGARVFTEMVKVKWGHMGGFQSSGMCVLTRRDQDTDPQRGKTLWRHREKVDVYTQRREASDISISVDNLVLNFQPPGLWNNKFPLCKRPSKLLQDPLKVGWLGLDERNLV